MKTRIIAVRHAQGEGNLLREFHGQYNSDLTELGLLQAECTAQFLKDVKIDKAYSSDILRARQTSEIIARELGLEIEFNPLLRELNKGILTGMNKKEANYKWMTQFYGCFLKCQIFLH